MSRQARTGSHPSRQCERHPAIPTSHHLDSSTESSTSPDLKNVRRTKKLSSGSHVFLDPCHPAAPLHPNPPCTCMLCVGGWDVRPAQERRDDRDPSPPT